MKLLLNSYVWKHNCVYQRGGGQYKLGPLSTFDSLMVSHDGIPAIHDWVMGVFDFDVIFVLTVTFCVCIYVQIAMLVDSNIVFSSSPKPNMIVYVENRKPYWGILCLTEWFLWVFCCFGSLLHQCCSFIRSFWPTVQCNYCVNVVCCALWHVGQCNNDLVWKTGGWLGILSQEW